MIIKSLKRILVLCISACLITLQVNARLRDTSLSILYTKPFFFNVIKTGDGKVYAGTSEGIHRMEGAAFVITDRRVGYLTVDSKGKLTIDSNGICYHDQKAFMHLLPFPNEKRDEYHAGTDEHFYIVSGGRMHVYDILPYSRLYRNHSVRTASSNFVGTYSGIYYRGIKLPVSEGFPRFTDGYIRELNGKAFICYSFLSIADLHGGDSLPTLRNGLPKGFGLEFVRNILFSEKHARYFTATTSGLGSIDSDLIHARPLYAEIKREREVVLLGEVRNGVLFAAGPDLMIHLPTTGENRVLATLPEQILDGHSGNLSHQLLCNNGLFAVYSDGQTKKLIDLNKAHTMLSLGGSDYAIATDVGLFLYNIASNKLSELIRGVEFNRRGLYLKGDSLMAGSIDGLYVLDAKNLEQLAEKTSRSTQGQGMSATLLALLAGMTTLACVLSVFLFRSRRHLRIIGESQTRDKTEVTREDIEMFIRGNLAIASLKSITDRFQTTNANVYQLLTPEKPGSFINRLRMERVQLLRKENKSAKEIAEQTGFSVSYVWKIWKQVNRDEKK